MMERRRTAIHLHHPRRPLPSWTAHRLLLSPRHPLNIDHPFLHPSYPQSASFHLSCRRKASSASLQSRASIHRLFHLLSISVPLLLTCDHSRKSCRRRMRQPLLILHARSQSDLSVGVNHICASKMPFTRVADTDEGVNKQKRGEGRCITLVMNIVLRAW